jgi:hypothetical protein
VLLLSIQDDLKALATRLNLPVTQIQAEFDAKVKEYTDNGIPPKNAQAVALKAVKGLYNAQLKSNAKVFEGYFFGVTPKNNTSRISYENATKDLDELKKQHGEKWVAVALEQKKINEKGEPLYTEQNTTKAQSWMVGKVIPKEKWEKVAYGMFKVKDTTEVKFGVMYVRKLDQFDDEFSPELLRVYTFRAGCKDTETDILNLNSTTVTKLQPTEIYETYEKFVSTLGKKAKGNLATFKSLYDLDNKQVNFKDGLPKIAIVNAIISQVSVLEEYSINYLDVTDLNCDFENVTMTIEKADCGHIYEQAVCIVVFRPYFRKAETPWGMACGVIIDPRYKKPAEIKPIDPDERKSSTAPAGTPTTAGKDGGDEDWS